MRSKFRGRLSVFSVGIASVVCLAAMSARSGAAAVGPGGACGPATVGTIAAVDAAVTKAIYANELVGPEVSWDLSNIASAIDLASAVAAENRPATVKAVSRIVFHPLWSVAFCWL